MEEDERQREALDQLAIIKRALEESTAPDADMPTFPIVIGWIGLAYSVGAQLLRSTEGGFVWTFVAAALAIGVLPAMAIGIRRLAQDARVIKTADVAMGAIWLSFGITSALVGSAVVVNAALGRAWAPYLLNCLCFMAGMATYWVFLTMRAREMLQSAIVWWAAGVLNAVLAPFTFLILAAAFGFGLVQPGYALRRRLLTEAKKSPSDPSPSS